MRELSEIRDRVFLVCDIVFDICVCERDALGVFILIRFGEL